MGGLSDLDFSPGLEIQRLVHDRFNLPVSAVSNLPEFFLVCSFGRSALRLNEDSVSLFLQSCLGGIAKDFNVFFLSGTMYRFSVSSKSVGFLVHKLRSFKCDLFAIFFALWSNGGPNSTREHLLWLEEENANWTYVGHKSSKKSYAQVVNSSRVHKESSPRVHRSSVFSRISFSCDEDACRAAGTAMMQKLEMTRAGAPPVNQDCNVEHAAPISAINPHFPYDGLNSRSRSVFLCYRCLSPGHISKTCSREVRCKSCYKYGHKMRTCFSRKPSPFVYRPISRLGPQNRPPESSKDKDINASQTPPTKSPAASPSSPRCSENTTPTPPADPPRSAAMANFPVDPRPHAPRGFEVIPHDPAVPPLRLTAYLGSCMDPYNDDVAIAMLVPAVAKEDFDLMAAAIKDYFIHSHRVRLMEVQPCAMGDAYVRFSSPLEREHFLDSIYQITPEYQLHFVKHDEGLNARFHDADREAWVMLLGYPLDAKNNTSVAKAVAGFGLLRHWHDTNYNARIVVRVFLKDDAKIPHDVTVSVGLPPKMRSWTCPVFALKKKNVTLLADEDETPDVGQMHPLPVGAPRWMGHNPADPSSVMQDPSANQDADPILEHVDATSEEAAGSEAPVQVAPAPVDPVPPVVRNVPAPVPVEKSPNVVFGPALPPDGQPPVPYSDDEDEDDEVKMIPAPAHVTPSKHRARKLKEPLDDVFLRRSKRLYPDIGGFRDEESAKEADEYPTPLAIVPPIYSGSAAEGASSAAPYLPLETIQGVAVGFLQMQPGAVAAEVLLELDNDDAM